MKIAETLLITESSCIDPVIVGFYESAEARER